MLMIYFNSFKELKRGFAEKGGKNYSNSLFIFKILKRGFVEIRTAVTNPVFTFLKPQPGQILRVVRK